ncbi:uncharacterized protein LOC111325240 isoform X2 [Stylophora pistillata]|uniref:uncharacterized protein LOC111325240 isoform X2 n=1 Tax=Stylophora pistillata TaxID=50429 RepID=UPI000C05602E|nr:uncharacterized protein LOC111325240 isoform X2 [Stylophora pistillata]
MATALSADNTMASAKGNLKVSIKIFSGLPDPEWQVIPSDPNYNKINELLNTARTGGFVLNPFKDMPARLGFKGFTIQDTTKGIKDLEYIYGPHTVKLQQLLLQSMPSEVLSGKLREDLSKEIGKEALGATSSEATSSESTSSDSTNSPTVPHSESGNLKVTMLVFSGRPDPQWEILPTDPNHDKIKQSLDTARDQGFIRSIREMQSRLGYKGFLIQDTAKNNEEPEFIAGRNTVQLQQLLLQTLPDGSISADYRRKILEEIKLTPSP